MRKSSVIVGLIESATLVIFAIAIMVNAQRDHSTVGSPIVQSIIYVIFAAGIGLVTYGLSGARAWARTPFIVVQLFAFIIAYTLAVGSSIEAKSSAAVIAVLAMIGVYAAWRD